MKLIRYREKLYRRKVVNMVDPCDGCSIKRKHCSDNLARVCGTWDNKYHTRSYLKLLKKDIHVVTG